MIILRSIKQWIVPVLGALLLGGCVSATVDEMTYNEPVAGIGESSVVILGRRHAPDYDTEFDFIRCIGDHIRDGDPSINVIDEITFINEFYPWFEPRTAPMQPQSLRRIIGMASASKKLQDMQLEYIIWIDGVTDNSFGERRDGNIANLTCSMGGCFGLLTWGIDSEYEATIWDFTDSVEVGKVSAEASGQSYMPAVFVPIPILAPVKGTACDSLGDQLLEYLSAHH